jgi:hypothetical protein
MKNKAIIFGPFIGEILWELYYFVPHFIYRCLANKKDKKIIVITREDRFDLYGMYTDIFSPIRIEKDINIQKNHFSISGLSTSSFNKIKKDYIQHFEKTFIIDEVICPKISAWKKDIKWQFPRDETNYNFFPRKENKKSIQKLLNGRDRIIFNNTENIFVGYKNIRPKHIDDIVKDNKKVSFYGLLIEILRYCDFYIGDFNSEISRISMLMNVPVISENVYIKYPELKLINPLNSIIIEEEYSKGITLYENNFRLEKDRTGK